MKLKLLDELLDHLSMSQGGDLKSLLMDSEKKETPEMEASESPEMQALEDKMGTEEHMAGKPKGIAVEKVSIMGKPKGDMPEEASKDIVEPGKEMGGGDDQMSDEELEEMLRKLS